jgi:hypothetical protein
MAKTIDDHFFQDVTPEVPSTGIGQEKLSDDEFTRLVDRVVNPHPSNYTTTNFIDGATGDRARLFGMLRTPKSCFGTPRK